MFDGGVLDEGEVCLEDGEQLGLTRGTHAEETPDRSMKQSEQIVGPVEEGVEDGKGLLLSRLVAFVRGKEASDKELQSWDEEQGVGGDHVMNEVDQSDDNLPLGVPVEVKDTRYQVSELTCLRRKVTHMVN